MTLPPKTRYPGYDVLQKRDSLSWDDPTRGVIDERMAVPARPVFCDAVQWRALSALCDCLMPQNAASAHRPKIPVAALVDAKIAANRSDGYRDARLPPLQEAWRTGLVALDAQSRSRFALPFASLDDINKNTLVEGMQRGELNDEAWNGMPSNVFFSERVLHDICAAYYSHPYAWSEIGFGGPANPRGYVRMYFNRRDPWEAVEVQDGDEERARRENRHAR